MVSLCSDIDFFQCVHVLTIFTGRFLPDLVLCMHGACDNTLDVNALLTPLSLACQLAGTPISPSALANAQSQGSVIAHPSTITVTQIQSGMVTIYGPTPSNTAPGVVTVTQTQTQVVVPVASTTTQAVVVVPAASTATQVVPATTDYTGVIPLVIVGTNGAGSTYTTTTTQPGTLSTYTTTDSAGSTTTAVSTYTQTVTQSSSQAASSGSSASGAGGGTMTSTSTVTAAPQSTGSSAASKASTAPGNQVTNSSPFGMQNVAGQERVGRWLGLTVGFVVVGLLL